MSAAIEDMAGVAGIAKDVLVQQQLASSAIPLLLKVHAINFYQNVIMYQSYSLC